MCRYASMYICICIYAYAYIYVWLVGWLVGWLFACLRACLLSGWQQTSPKILEDGLQNPPQIHQAGGQDPVGSFQKSVLERSWAILGPRWPQVGSNNENV